MNKKIISIIAIVAIIAILGVVLIACNASDYSKKLEKKGYAVTVVNGDDDSSYDFIVNGTKASLGNGVSVETVTVTKYKKSEDAKKAYNDAKSNDIAVSRSGKIVIVGTEQGVKDAK